MRNEGQAKAYLDRVPMWAKKKNSLTDIRAFLEEMGNPDESMQLIHVAGTNGKGSVCAYLTSILREAGFTAAAFTSPHLIDVKERFCLNGVMVMDGAFEESFQHVKKLSERMMEKGYCHPSYFEFLFYMAMNMFERAGLDYVILETGLGGRLDATNVIRSPLVCVITSVSMDHMAYLGDTIGEIASEKAGIIKNGVPVVYDDGNEEVSRVIEETALQLGTECIPVRANEYRITKYGDTFLEAVLKRAHGTDMAAVIPSAAEYQVMNGLLAVRAAEKIPGIWIPEAAVRHGLLTMYWPGRMEEALPGVWLDGAHNEGGIKAFISTALRMCTEQKKRAYLLFAAVSDKEHKAMIRDVCQALPLDRVAVAHLDSQRGTESGVLASEFLTETDCRISAWKDVNGAFADVSTAMDGKHLLFCVGSLYLIGEIKALIKENPKAPSLAETRGSKEEIT